jgi:hypothetical protein
VIERAYPFRKARRMITPHAGTGGALLLEGLRIGKGAIRFPLLGWQVARLTYRVFGIDG